jgi:SAM-dependent methyltransferase
MTTRDASAAVPHLVRQHLDVFQCPGCGGPLQSADASTLACRACQRTFASEGGIPLLFWPTEWTDKQDVTDTIKAFYEETPFPNYDELDSPESLRAKAERGVFARLLNEQIPYGSRILEAGCGTGQLSNFLGLTWGRFVVGTDICLNSLRLGQAFKDRHDVPAVAFVQMNLFRPVFRPATFDVVISNGVLHHTSDPFLAFRSILTCVKKGGFIVIGLYNAYGRLSTDLRRQLFRLGGDRLAFLDPRLRLSGLSRLRKTAWFKDQYQHPHESKHSFGEVLRWFDRTGVTFMTGIPTLTATDSFSDRERLFESHPRGNSLDHVLVQLGMVLSGGREGGFFIMIGRKDV